MNSYSQSGEDQWVWDYLGRPSTGTFCEVGAYDGIKSSNTKLFEKFGWLGFVVEADPMLAHKCIEQRQCMVFCCAVGLSTHGWFNIHPNDRGLSGFNTRGMQIMVLVKRLDWLLIVSDIGNLTVLSIDTEGTELEVWESIGSIRPRIVIIEYVTGDNPPQDKEILERMTRDGYKEIHRTKHNLILEYGSTEK